MPSITDADGNVLEITSDGRALVSIDGSVAQADVGIKNVSDVTINPSTEETLEAVRALLAAEDFASEATLEAIRALLAAEDFASETTLLTRATEATLEALRLINDNRLPKNAKQYADGKYRNAGGVQPVGASGSGFLQIENPTGSGVTITLTEFVLAATINATAQFLLDATLTSPTVLDSWMPNRAYEGVATTQAVVRRSSGATGGTLLSPQYRLPADIPVHQEFVLTLMPGQSIAVEADSGLLQSFDLYASATWIEEPI